MTDTVREINEAMCKALGVEDTGNVSRVVLTMEPNRLPSITVERHIRDADDVVLSISRMDITSIAREGQD